MEFYASSDRLRGYAEELAENGITYDPALVTRGDWQVESGYAGAVELLAAEPRLDGSAPKAPLADAAPASALDDGPGCPFRPRCPVQLGERCATEMPAEQIAADGHRIACHRPLAELMGIP